MNVEQLDPITPSEAKEKYLKERQEDASYSTQRTITKGVDLFVEWTQEAEIDNMNEIRGRQLREFKQWCKTVSENNTVSLNGILSVLRRFLVFCVQIEAVYSNVPDKTPIPNVPDDEGVSYQKPSDEEVEATIEFLKLHEPCSRRHVEYRLVKELGDRVGTVRGIDVGDVYLDECEIHLRHRPEKEFEDSRGTPLKNGSDGERNQNIPNELADLIGRYLNSPQRHDVTDKFGRKPLLTTPEGRPKISTIRRDLYKLTRPCEYTGECPHGRDVDSCDAAISTNASECPDSHSPHPLRRWSIEHQIETGVSKEILCDRVDVSVSVLNEHYDTRSKERKRKHRLDVLEKIFDDYGDPEATIDAGVLVDMFINRDGTVDTKALLEFDTRDQEDEPSQSGDQESKSGDQMTFDQLTDGTTGALHPVLIPVFAGLAAMTWSHRRLRRELNHLTDKPKTRLRPSRNRLANGMSAYALFTGMIAVNLILLGLIPSGIA